MSYNRMVRPTFATGGSGVALNRLGVTLMAGAGLERRPVPIDGWV